MARTTNREAYWCSSWLKIATMKLIRISRIKTMWMQSIRIYLLKRYQGIMLPAASRK